MDSENKLELGRKAFRRREWKKAYTLLSSTDKNSTLAPPDLEKLAITAFLIGKEPEYSDLWSRTHQGYLKQKKKRKAANCAFWLGMTLITQGKKAEGSGWIARAGRLTKNFQQECAEKGFLLVPEALQNLREGKAENAYDLFLEAHQIGNRCNNPDLIVLGLLGRGQALIQQNKINEGTTLFDEVMVAVVASEISPIVAGISYCAVIETCQKIYDLQRAQEWTEALNRWCNAQPDLIPYRGQCLVRRAEIMQLHGNWLEAMDELEQVLNLHRTSNPPVLGEAFYKKGELYRLQGNFTKAEKAYRSANKYGRNPQPGLALLRVRQGQIDKAKTAIENIKKGKQDLLARSRVLPAYIEIMLSAGDLKTAKNSAYELSDIAEKINAPILEAIAEYSLGNVLLSNEKPQEAITKLRTACQLLTSIGASYETARTHLLIGLAYRKLGDNDTAEVELNSAKSTFKELNAIPDINRINELISPKKSMETHGLTPRELQVLRILVTGRTNKEIADELFISERTVDRHVSNIMAKLDVPSRTAATTYAYKHNLI